jgi:hypothetical protein
MGEASSVHPSAPEAAAAAPKAAAAAATHQFQLRRRDGGAYVGSGDRKGQRRIEVR